MEPSRFRARAPIRETLGSFFAPMLLIVRSWTNIPLLARKKLITAFRTPPNLQYSTVL